MHTPKIFVLAFFTAILCAQSAFAGVPIEPPTDLAATVITGDRVDLTWIDHATNEDYFDIEQSTDGFGFSLIGNAPADAQSVSVGGLDPATLYFFRVRARDDNAQSSPLSNVAHAVTVPQPPKLSFQPLVASPKGLRFLGDVTLTGSSAVMTNAGSQTSAIWSKRKQKVGQFVCEFTFRTDIQSSSILADGLTFSLQRKGKAVIGNDVGGSLGYGGIDKSVAVKFDLYPESSTGFYANGAEPSDIEPDSITTGPGIDFSTGHTFHVILAYHHNVLDETIVDLTGIATFRHTYPADLIPIPTLIGGGKAYAGFTAATGAFDALQQIFTWTYAPLPTKAPARPTGLKAVAQSLDVSLKWKDHATDESAFIIECRRGTSGDFRIVGVNLSNDVTFTDFSVDPDTDYHYRVKATNAAGLDSGYTNLHVTTPGP